MNPERLIAKQLPLPPVFGNGNDYTFIEKRLLAAGLDSIRDYQPSRPVSIFITVRDRARLLRLTLESLATLDYPPELLQIIVVDDGSVDDPAGACAGANLPPIEWVRLEPIGKYTLPRARNTGIHAARHDLIVQLDPDILFRDVSALKAIVRWFEVSDAVLITVPRMFIESAGLVPDEVRTRSFAVRQTEESDGREDLTPSGLKRDPMPYMSMQGFCMAYSRARALHAGGHAEDRRDYGGSDHEFAYRYYETGAYCILEEAAASFHLRHPPLPNPRTDRSFMAERIPSFRHRRPDIAVEPGRTVPRVSVYIPAKNAERWIGDAIQSALSQSYQDLEVCICDDGSTDETAGVIQQCARLDRRVRWISTESRGCAAASRTAIGLTRGEYILQLDSDDVLHPQAVELLAAELDRRPEAGFVYANHTLTDEHLRPSRQGSTFARYVPHLLLTCMFICHPRMWRRRLYQLVGGHDESLVSAVDFDLFLRMSERSLGYYLNRYLYFYRMRPGSLSGNSPQQRRDSLKAIENALARRGLDQQLRAHQEQSGSLWWYSYSVELANSGVAHG